MQVDYALMSPTSQIISRHDGQGNNMIVNNYASEMQLNTNETAVINSSTMSMNSRGIPLNKAKS